MRTPILALGLAAMLAAPAAGLAGTAVDTEWFALPYVSGKKVSCVSPGMEETATTVTFRMECAAGKKKPGTVDLALRIFLEPSATLYDECIVPPVKIPKKRTATLECTVDIPPLAGS